MITVAFDVAPDCTVGDLKRLIQQYQGIDSLLETKITFSNIDFNSDDETLSDLGISSEIQIQCNIFDAKIHHHSLSCSDNTNANLNSPGMIISNDGNTKLVMQLNEDLVLYHRSNSTSEWIQKWSAGKAKSVPKDCSLVVQSDSNLCMYRPGGCYWCANTWRGGNTGRNTLIVHNDGTATLENERMKMRQQLWKIPP